MKLLTSLAALMFATAALPASAATYQQLGGTVKVVQPAAQPRMVGPNGPVVVLPSVYLVDGEGTEFLVTGNLARTLIALDGAQVSMKGYLDGTEFKPKSNAIVSITGEILKTPAIDMPGTHLFQWKDAKGHRHTIALGGESGSLGDSIDEAAKRGYLITVSGTLHRAMEAAAIMNVTTVRPIVDVPMSGNNVGRNDDTTGSSQSVAQQSSGAGVAH